jgi:hypothetical protein
MADGQNLTLTKLTIIVPILVVAIPSCALFFYEAVFPKNYLLYDIQWPVQTEDLDAIAIIVTNAGREAQDEVKITLPQDSAGADVKMFVSDASRYRSMLSEARPTEFVQGASTYQVNIGRISAGESVALLAAAKRTTSCCHWILFPEPKVESKQSVGLKADGIRYPENEDTFGGVLRAISVFVFPFLMATFVVVVITGFIFEAFFDTPERKIARLWRQMDKIQEEADKARRYRP